MNGAFRADKQQSSTHMTEFRMVEAETAFCSSLEQVSFQSFSLSFHAIGREYVWTFAIGSTWSYCFLTPHYESSFVVADLQAGRRLCPSLSLGRRRENGRRVENTREILPVGTCFRYSFVSALLYLVPNALFEAIFNALFEAICVLAALEWIGPQSSIWNAQSRRPITSDQIFGSSWLVAGLSFLTFRYTRSDGLLSFALLLIVCVLLRSTDRRRVWVDWAARMSFSSSNTSTVHYSSPTSPRLRSHFTWRGRTMTQRYMYNHIKDSGRSLW